MLSERVTDTVTEGEGVTEEEPQGEGVTDPLRDTLMVRERLRVGQLVAVLEEERHSVGESEGLGETEPVRDGVELTE